MKNNVALLASLASVALAQGSVTVKRIAAHARAFSEHDIREQVIAVRDDRAMRAYERRLASQIAGDRA